MSWTAGGFFCYNTVTSLNKGYDLIHNLEEQKQISCDSLRDEAKTIADAQVETSHYVLVSGMLLNVGSLLFFTGYWLLKAENRNTEQRRIPILSESASYSKNR